MNRNPHRHGSLNTHLTQLPIRLRLFYRFRDTGAAGVPWETDSLAREGEEQDNSSCNTARVQMPFLHESHPVPCQAPRGGAGKCTSCCCAYPWEMHMGEQASEITLEPGEQWPKDATPEATLHFQTEKEEPLGSHSVTSTKLSETGSSDHLYGPSLARGSNLGLYCPRKRVYESPNIPIYTIPRQVAKASIPLITPVSHSSRPSGPGS